MLELCCSVEGEEGESMGREASRLRVTALVEARGLTAASSRGQFGSRGLRLVGATGVGRSGADEMRQSEDANVYKRKTDKLRRCDAVTLPRV